MLPKKLQKKIESRKSDNSLRKLGQDNNLVDFSSNDYLGFSKSQSIFNKTQNILLENSIEHNGSTGSRLLTGNHKLYSQAENVIADFHQSETALIYNSGYDANLGFFSCVASRGDVIFYDEYIHASIRDGISISKAAAYKFRHNDINDLKEKLSGLGECDNIYIVTESIFSMDGDSPRLEKLTELSQDFRANLIIDEAHAVGVANKPGKGLVEEQNLSNAVFARIVTFGKALGCHGAAILCNKDLREYLINFSRAFIYTTALPPHSVAAIMASYSELRTTQEIEILQSNIAHFKSNLSKFGIKEYFIPSDSAIQSCVVSSIDKVKKIASQLADNGFNVKPILYPSVPKGQERLRFCIHSFNSKEQIDGVLNLLASLLVPKSIFVHE
ncbi:MAG: pyridoxal phosphate-dependent aminotransferase family protein [Flavobacteriaceae bacterium]|nr:pyridoxal phosphate-dependent aminotransferase family protein [Flavobacteriaceae bacterium]